jgi:hypothetical protein
VGFCKLQVQLNYGLLYFAQKRERNSGGIHIYKKKKKRREELRNPSKGKSDAEEKYLSL